MSVISNATVQIDIHKLLELLNSPSHIEKINQVIIKRSKGKFYNIAKNLIKWLKGKDKLDNNFDNLDKLLKNISKNKLDYSFGNSGFIAQDLAKILTINGKSIEYGELIKLLKDKNYRKSIADLLKINNEYITTNEGLREFVLKNIKQNPETIEDLLNNPEATKLLFSKVDINSIDSKGRTLLHCAVECEEDEIVKLLAENGANIDMAMLHYVIEYGKFKIFDFFMKALQTELLLGKKYHELFDHAIKLKRYDIINVLLDSTDINSIDSKGRTLLHCAIECADFKVVELLIKKGAKLNHVDHNGCTPLNLAIKARNVDVTNLLVDKRGYVKYTYMDNNNNITRVYTKDDYKFFSPLLKKRHDLLKKREQNSHPNTILKKANIDQPIVPQVQEVNYV